jgi:hypothetical protein
VLVVGRLAKCARMIDDCGRVHCTAADTVCTVRS